MDYTTKTRLVDRIATLRWCKRQIELFRVNYLVPYDQTLTAYNNELLALDVRIRRSSFKQKYKEWLRSRIEAELLNLRPQGAYRRDYRIIARTIPSDVNEILGALQTLIDGS